MKTSTIIYAIIISLMLLVGCNRGPKPGMEIGWPPPPQKAKIIYVESIYGSQNLKRNFWGTIKDFFFGKGEYFEIGKPYGVRQKEGQKFFIADTGKKGILVIDKETGTIKLYTHYSKQGALKEPVYVTLDALENIYVADTKLKRIIVFDKNFKFSHFIGVGQLEGPVGIAFDKSQQRVYVVDSQGHNVKIFDREGGLIGQFGGRGDNQGEFYYPLAVVVSKGDTVYVTDSFHFAVQAFDLDGNYLFSFGPGKDGTGTMGRPRDIAIDSDNNIYVTDALSNDVQIYNSTGDFLMRFGSGGIGPGQFRLPAGITIDDKDYIYIADSINRRIQVFRYSKEI